MVYLAIDELLEKNGKTRYWLSKEIGTDFGTINKWCTNQNTLIALESIDKICEAFGCEPGDVVKRK